jgi:alginate O-acetyltransferase complex protein AlgI
VAFSSPRFLIFLAVLLALLWPRYGTARKKNVLAAASCLFYAAWDYRYLALLLLVSVIDYAAAARIHAAAPGDARRRKGWLWLSVVSNLSILGYFKYYNFFVDNLNGALAAGGLALPHQEILLPAGISFYTFKSMSYTIDVYRGHIEPCESHLDYTTFITFFPELIAGPIVRASVFLPQMGRPIGPSAERLQAGASLFLLGLTKKRLVADRMAGVADRVFASPEIYSTPTLWFGVAAYTIQIYCDFSGYSDMAVGTAKMIGYDLPENFAMPYLAGDVSEFWRRWHITLSQWLRDYLYVPLGGNRRGPLRTYLNLSLTMLLGGLWHGASWNFVLWGALHGGALAAHRFYRGRAGGFRLPRPVGVALTLVFVMLCWVPFRAATFGQTTTILAGLFGRPEGRAFWVPEYLFWALGLMAFGHYVGWRLQSPGVARALAWFDAQPAGDEISGPYVRFGLRGFGGALLLTFWLLMLLYFINLGSPPFIYFQF